MKSWLLWPVLGQAPRDSVSFPLTLSQLAPASGKALKNGARSCFARHFQTAGFLQGKRAFCDTSLKIIFIRFHSLRSQNNNSKKPLSGPASVQELGWALKWWIPSCWPCRARQLWERPENKRSNTDKSAAFAWVRVYSCHWHKRNPSRVRDGKWTLRPHTSEILRWTFWESGDGLGEI